MNFDYCSNIIIKYDFTLNPLSNVLEHYVYLAKEVNKFKKEKINEERKIEIFNKKLERLSEQNRKYAQKIKSCTITSTNNNQLNHVEDTKKLIEINKLTIKISNYKNEISELKTELNKFNNIEEDIININEYKNRINALTSKNKTQEEKIQHLIDEISILKKNIKKMK